MATIAAVAGATIAAAVATIATVALAMAAAAAAMATVATATAAVARAGTATVVVAIAAIARRIAAIAAIAAFAAEEAGVGLLLAAHEGDTNQREKDRDTQNNNTVHPRILQLLTGTSKRENYPSCVTSASSRRTTAGQRDATLRTPARIRSRASREPL